MPPWANPPGAAYYLARLIGIEGAWQPGIKFTKLTEFTTSKLPRGSWVDAGLTVKPGHKTRLPGLALIGIFAALTLLLAATAQAQRGRLLEITAPADGTVIAPGQTITVVVTPAPGVAFATGIVVVGSGPIADSGPVLGPPFEFALMVPSDAPSGKYLITASGAPASNCVVTSPSIALDVERPDIPTLLSSESAQMQLESVGQELPLRITGTFADGTTADLTRSSKIAYRSLDPTVATVDGSGVVTAVGAGTTFVVASYQGPSAAVRIVVLTPVLALSSAGLVFPDQLVGDTSGPQTITVINISSVPVTIMNVATSEDFAASDNCVSSSPLPVGNACTIDVRFTPTGSGHRNGKLTIGNTVNVAPPSVSLAGQGLPGQTNLAPPASAGTEQTAECSNSTGTDATGFPTAPVLGN
jgi:hypothetical protein